MGGSVNVCVCVLLLLRLHGLGVCAIYMGQFLQDSPGWSIPYLPYGLCYSTLLNFSICLAAP